MDFPLWLLITITLTEVALLYLFSRTIMTGAYTLFMKLTRNQSAAVAIISFLFLPGTAIHEFAHLIVAEVLRVPTGKLSFAPKIESQPNGRLIIKGGSLKIAQTDPVRRYLIGFAPVFIGLAALTICTYLLFQQIPLIIDLKLRILAYFGVGYLLFTSSNTMFSSPQDLAGFAAFAPIIALFIGLLYIVGIRISITPETLQTLSRLFSHFATVLAVVLTINTTVILMSRGIGRIVRK